MKSRDTVPGLITEALSGGRYRVAVQEKEVICYVAGKMQMNKIRVGLNDKVEVILDPHGGNATNRIVRRT